MIQKRKDKQGREIWGDAPDRTCLNCFIGFSIDLMDKEGLSPCCKSCRHVSAIWYDVIKSTPINHPIK